MGRSVYQYEQPRCPDNWNESERRFYNRLIETLDDIYSKYGRLDTKMLAKSVIERIDNSTATSLETMVVDILSAGKIAADSIEATFASLVSLSAKYGSFDFETVKNLVADAMVLEKGQADYVHITNLAATYAQAVNATIGNLVIQSSDGGYYQLDVDASGKVSAEKVELTDGEIAAGETGSGKVIVGTHITAETLGTATLAATQALVNMIDASRINVDTLVAREEFVQTLTANEAFINSLVANSAFIKVLSTTTIVGDKSITMIANSSSTNFRQEEMPTGDIKVGDTWTIPSLGIMYSAADASELNVRFYLDADGSLYYEADAEDELLAVEGYDLYAEDLAFRVDEHGDIKQVIRWKIVTDLSGIEAAQDEIYANQLRLQEEQGKMSTYLKLEPDMVRIGSPGFNSEVQINAVAMGVAVNGKIFSRFEAQRAVFGDMEIRRPTRGGLVFDSVDEGVSVFGNRV